MKRKSPPSLTANLGKSGQEARARRAEALIAAAAPAEQHTAKDELAGHASPLSLYPVADTDAPVTLPLSKPKATKAERTMRGAKRAARAAPIEGEQGRAVNPPPEIPTTEAKPAAIRQTASAEAGPQTDPAPGAREKPGRKSANTPNPSSRQSATQDDPEITPTTAAAPEANPAGLNDNSGPAPRPAAPPREDLKPSPAPGASDAAAGATDTMALPDMEVLARNMGRFIESSGKAASAYLEPRKGGIAPPPGEEMVTTLNSLGRVAESWLTNPTRMIQAQAALSTQLFTLWNSSLMRLGQPAAAEAPRTADRRFAAPEWRKTPFFDFLHQAYLITTDWAKALVADAEGVDEATREKAAFYLRQISSALSPSNFLATNPELLKETFKEKGANLVRGMEMLAEDIAAGKGDLKIRQSDASKFKLGVDMASTPGKVVFRNDLMELLQYAPSTPDVLKRPLLIVPPWINKFYVLDLNREKSFIRWAVSQGLSVFVISWVNPDERHARKDWDAYLAEGIVAALDAIEQAIGERDVSTVGYCVGGTLLAATLAYMAGKGDTRVSSTTFLTTQVDFKDAGDLKVFADEAQIRAVERQMSESGYLAGSRMANAFNMLRPDDLIWSYSVSNYIKGKAPKPFDLLAWNADSTRMSAANHAFYLRNCYLENNLTKGEMVLAGERLDLAAVTIPVYDLAAKEDHIAPARSVFAGAKFFGGPVRYVMAGSGHIAGVVNPPAKAKYQYWTGGRMDGGFEDWVATATEVAGTWWLDWIEWIKAQAPATVAARTPGDGGLPALGDAPGDYVRVQS